jgi:hypothetical protein
MVVPLKSQEIPALWNSSFFKGMKYKAQVRLRRGTFLSPLAPLGSRSDDDVLSVQELSHLGGAEAAGVKPP